jgi:lipoyl(octanoyl) transferase
LLYLNLGRQPYSETWDLQHRLVRARQQESVGDIVILVEHEPVITLGRAADASHVLASATELRDLGIAVHRVERGGDATYHGPGQLVGYPILRLADYHLGVADYMHALEQVLINALADLGCRAFRRDGIIGVWTEQGKIAALGARVERGTTYHGFALNVDPPMEHYRLIIPCGLVDESIASLRQALRVPVPMAKVQECVVLQLGQVFERSMVETNLQQIGFLI